MPKVLLIRNYASDAQPSMQRFASMLEQGLQASGWDVTVAEPPVVFGKGRQTQCGLGKWLGYLDKYLLARKTLRSFAKQCNADIVHICDHSNAIYAPLFREIPTLITCHDMLAIRCWLGEIPGQQKSLTGGLQQRWILKHLRRIPTIVCVSKATQADLERLAPECQGRSVLIPVGLNHPYTPLAKQEQIARLSAEPQLSAHLDMAGQRYPFLLHVGNNAWYKNRRTVLDIYKSLLTQDPKLPHRLLMAGAAPDDILLDACEGIRERVLFLKNIDTRLLETVYTAADCLIFPSLAEGFGWPPIEAQASGCPVAISKIEPMVSNCGPSALTFDPYKPDEAALSILTLLRNPKQQNAVRNSGLCNAKRFTAEAMVQAYAHLYQTVLHEDSTPG